MAYKDDYKTSRLGFPNVRTPEKEKGAEYHGSWAKGIHSEWHKGKTAIPYSYQHDIDMLRKYGAGMQPIDQYLKQDVKTGGASSTIDTSDGDSLKWDRDGKNNLDMSIISIAPRVKSMIKSYLGNIQEDVVVDTIDPKSGSSKEDQKWALMLYAKDREFIDSYMKRAGLQPDEPDFVPETVDELEMYEEVGGFKLAFAADMEKLVKYSIEMSGYEHDLADDIYDDLMDIGIAATKKKLDPEDLKFKDSYVDPKHLVVQHSMHNDFRDIDWAGHVEYYTLARLRKFFPDKDEAFFKDIAQDHSSLYGNPGEFKKYDVVTTAGGWGYDNFLIAVFEAEWRDEEVEQAVFYDNKNGKTSQLPVTEETTSNLNARKRYVRSNLEKRRECSWVIGTDCVFDWGEVNMQDRPAQNKTISNYHIRALSDAPLMAQLKPVLDDMQISWFRFQDARANAAKSGYAVNVSKLKAISDGTTKYDLGSILKLWKERGLLLYQDSITGRYEGGKTLPIDRLPDSLLDQLQEFVGTWDHALKRMEDLTGINALMLGAAPDPNAPVTTQKLSVASSANAIKGLAVAMNDIKRKSAESFMRRFILACKARKDIIDSYEGVIGRTAIERLIEAGRTMVDYGMKFTPRPTETEKAALLEASNVSMMNRREGRPGIDLQTKMFIEEQLYAGVNLKWLRFYIGWKEKQIFKQDQDAKMAMIEAQNKANMQMQQQKQQGDMQQKQMETESDAALNDRQAKNEMVKELAKKDDNISRQVARRMGFGVDQSMPAGAPNNPVEPLSPQNGM